MASNGNTAPKDLTDKTKNNNNKIFTKNIPFIKNYGKNVNYFKSKKTLNFKNNHIHIKTGMAPHPKPKSISTFFGKKTGEEGLYEQNTKITQIFPP